MFFKCLDEKYLLVMEYVEGGSLHNYLKENFSSLNWQDKCRLAFQLASAIECLHKSGIVHNNLHPNNVLVQQNSIKLADFGLGKRIKNTYQISVDTIPYNDPGGFSSGKEKQLEKLKKSDIYSVGVLFWELSSGKIPFADEEYGLSLAMEIGRGLRECVIEGTPKKYSSLYESK